VGRTARRTVGFPASVAAALIVIAASACSRASPEGPPPDTPVAGASTAHELPASDYKIVVTAAGQELTTPVTLGVAKDATLRITIKNDRLVAEQ
jgi:hypothetical protein